MTNDDFRRFTCIVAGENPEEIMAKYDMSKNLKTNVIYKFADASKIKDYYIKMYKQILADNNFAEITKKQAEEDLESIQEQTDTEFFLNLTEDYDHDEKTGDAIENSNPHGKWLYKMVGKDFSIPFKTFDGEETHQARKCDVDWSKIHLVNQDIYRATWEMIMGNREPITEEERLIYENMKERKEYFKKFGDKKTYVISNTAFWGFAFCDENQWFELEPNVNQFSWASEFYYKFIEPLPDNTLLTIYECRRD